MIPRGRPDIGWLDLALAIGDALRRQPVPPLGVWPDARDALACRSVRSGLDLLLRAWRFPPGEALVSAVNIPGMFAVLRAHGLTPVPVHQSMSDLALDPAHLERAVTPTTRLVLVSHLFGGRMPLDAVVGWAQTRGLPVIEDCAQAFIGPAWNGHPGCAASLFSFGSIKTATALGGGVMHLRDRRLLATCLALQVRDRMPSRISRVRRVLLAALLRLITIRTLYALLASWLRRRGVDLDDWVRQQIRGFPDDDVARLREQPGGGLVRTLRRRIHGFSSDVLGRRRHGAEAVLTALPDDAACAGRAAGSHTWWCLPLLFHDPDAAVAALRRQGIDATRRGSALTGLGEAATGALRLERAVYLPVRGLTDNHRQRIADAVAADRR